MSDYRFERVSESHLESISDLLLSVFPKASHLTPKYLRWQYFQNPFGKVIGWNAYDPKSGELAAHYVVIPQDLNWGGRERKAALSLNTATSPLHQGKGLFVKLAEMTFQSARDAGIVVIYGVANQNSTPGFVKKLGFTLVCPLEAHFSFTPPSFQIQDPHSFSVAWSEDSIRWRTGRPYSNYRSSRDEMRIIQEVKKGLLEFTLSDRRDGFSEKSSSISLIQGWIGKSNTVRLSSSIRLPQWLKPSPLNLIYKGLTSESAAPPTPEQVHFQLIDFDAY